MAVHWKVWSKGYTDWPQQGARVESGHLPPGDHAQISRSHPASEQGKSGWTKILDGVKDIVLKEQLSLRFDSHSCFLINRVLDGNQLGIGQEFSKMQGGKERQAWGPLVPNLWVDIQVIRGSFSWRAL